MTTLNKFVVGILGPNDAKSTKSVGTPSALNMKKAYKIGGWGAFSNYSRSGFDLGFASGLGLGLARSGFDLGFAWGLGLCLVLFLCVICVFVWFWFWVI